MSARDERADVRWLLLIHQIPPKPDYLRVKIGRRLQRVGAVPVKNSVYVLPDNEQAHEDFQWIRTEIVDGGGDASICRADFVDGLTSEQLRDAFRRARGADYTEVAEAARELTASARRLDAGDRLSRGARLDEELARLRKRVAAIAAIDYFDAPERASTEHVLDATEAELHPRPAPAARSRGEGTAYRGRTWVTRAGIFVDRMASAWLIRRFIDPEARFRFVRASDEPATPDELRFDMFEGEFTHEGDRCTFETLLERFSLDDGALRAIAEVVHDIDLKDAKFERDDAAGIERVLTGIAAAHPDDAARLERGCQLFDELYAVFSSRASSGSAGGRS
ncbi:MAG TPA: chromate resistance protein ChrB domain-containing protein [Gemmatimonadaceae bacterium]|jgi:hypothetical protein|nr:chromate resistance protein ChrB domain-containing protein [Gemmatimonadaceae bacterium]